MHIHIHTLIVVVISFFFALVFVTLIRSWQKAILQLLIMHNATHFHVNPYGCVSIFSHSFSVLLEVFLISCVR